MTKTDRETVKGFSKSSAAVRVSFLFQLCYAPLEEQEKLRGKSLPVPAAAAAAAAGEAAAALVIKPGVPLVISGGWQGSEVIMSGRFNNDNNDNNDNDERFSQTIILTNYYTQNSLKVQTQSVV
jgi:hypothetical protein